MHHRMLAAAVIGLLFSATGWSLAEDKHASDWKYIVPPAGDAFAHPPLRALALSDQPPNDFECKVAFRGKRQRYAQLRYGSPNSVRVVIVLDEAGPGDVDLYVDRHRNRALEAKDKVSGNQQGWQMPLEVAIVEGNVVQLIPRTVLFRYGRASRTLAYATCGYVEGRTKLGEATITVRRVDGDGNGFLTDAQDRLWIDRDGAGRWDPLQDQFPFAPLLNVGKERFVVQSDPLGTRLTFAKLEGTGTVRLAAPSFPGGAVEDMSVTLQSRDGIVATLQGKDAEMVVPVGEYRCVAFLLGLKDRKTGQSWGYIFSDSGAARQEWHKVSKDARVLLDPVGHVSFTIDGCESGKCPAGGRLNCRPGLYTGDGLLITTVYFGRELSSPFADGPHAKIQLIGADGGKLEATTSGFA